MKRIRFSRFGTPSEVAELVDADPPRCGAADALVRMLASPINPADHLLMTGNHASRPPLPAFAGIEGVGEVVEAPAGTLAPGTHVILPPGSGTWSELVAARADGLVPVPRELDVVQAAMLGVNPATAWLMIELTQLAPGEWLVQNAASSAVGKLMIRLAHARGVRTVNIVRRAEVEPALRELGADCVLVGEDDLAARVRQATGGAPVRWAFDAVAGASAGVLAGCLAPGGTLVTYGLLSYQPVQLPAPLVVFGDLTFRGFSRYAAVAKMGPAAARQMYARLAELVLAGTLRSEVEAIYPLERAREALAHSERGGRDGKIVLSIAS